MRNVLIPVFDGLQSLDLTGPLEVFAHAAGYAVTTASLGGGPVRTTSGLRLAPDTDLQGTSTAALDLLLVPGGAGARRRDPGLVSWIRDHAPDAGMIASVCTGAFLLAEAGILAGKTVTTHWAKAALLAEQYPDLTVDPDPIFIRDGDIATSAGITAGIDLALALVEDDLGRDRALDVARQLVVFLRRPGSQSQFSAQLEVQAATREPLRDVQHWIAEHPAADLSVESLAQRASLSARHFARAFAAETGMTPGRYVDKTRIEAARRHLEDTAASVEQTARACGYGTTETMRRAFIRVLGVSPAEYRRRFRPKELV
ncbi:MAG TPA: DJ-1/PfpI family protein [Trebonia sp.]|jgi:transcriptional regulator GlxA family with amidase domain